LFTYGTIDNPNYQVRDFGGGTLAGGHGAAPKWARLGYVQYTATAGGTVDFESSQGFLQFSLFGGGNVAWPDVNFGSVSLTSVPQLSIAGVTKAEGDADTTDFEFVATLSHPSNQEVTVAYTTQDGTATVDDNDYQLTTGTLTFAPGQTQKTITVPVIGDLKVEDDETFSVILSDPTNATITQATATGTIVNDDDDNAAFSINSVSLSEGMVSDNDYQAKSGTLTFAAGQQSQTVTVLVNGDVKVEDNETFLVNLSDAKLGGATDTRVSILGAAGTGTILNDDNAAFSINSVSLSEGHTGTTAFEFTVSLSAPVAFETSVAYATADGTAMVSDNDYEAKSGTLTFAAGQQSQTVTVLVNGDVKVENDETFLVNLSDAKLGGATDTRVSILGAAGTGTILNDDNAAFSINSVSLSEGHTGTTEFEFTVSLSAPVAFETSVAYATADGTAMVSDNDYEAKSGTLTFAAGQQSQTVTVLVNGDVKVEDNETFLVNLSDAKLGGATDTRVSILGAAGTGTILNDDNAAFSINSVSLSEGHTGTTAFEFTVSLSAPVAFETSVAYATADGTAMVSDNDYEAKSGTLTFAAGQQSQTVTVLVNGDVKVENDETFLVNLSDAKLADETDARVSILGAQGTGTILNDDTATFSINSVSLSEGHTGTTAFEFTVSLSAPVAFETSVAYATADGTAMVSDNDYEAKSGTLTFAAGQQSQTVTVLVNGDVKVEDNETFLVNLSDAKLGGATDTRVSILGAAGTGTILNDDNAAFSINSVSLSEGHTGTTEFEFTVSLSAPVAFETSVAYATADGTAMVSDNDYEAKSGTLTFAAGQQSQTVTVLVNGDVKVEDNETFLVNLSDAKLGGATDTRVSILGAAGTGTILNDDNAAFSINSVSLSEGHTGTTEFEFTVSLSAPVAFETSVAYATADGTAMVSDNDYEAKSGTLTFAAGQQSQTVTVLVNGDVKVEDNETFLVNLSDAKLGGATDTRVSILGAAGTGTILNDDNAAFSINSVSLSEGHTGTTAFEFTVSLSAPVAFETSVAYATADGTAMVSDNDYQAKSGTLTFAAGQQSQTVTVLVNGDVKVEDNETFLVNLSDAKLGGATDTRVSILGAAGTGTILNDDNAAFSINSVSLSEGHTGTTAFEFTVSLSAPVAFETSVAYATADGTAMVSDNDYQAKSGTLTFAAGQQSQTVTVLVNGDVKVEDNETFLVNLSDAKLGGADGRAG
jgi:fibronectin-binding autotransporter adhesin